VDKRILLRVRMQYTCFGNVCLQTCYNTTITVHLLHIKPTFPETHCAYDVTQSLKLSAYNFHGTIKHANFCLLYCELSCDFSLNTVGNSEHDGTHSQYTTLI
jgi:hypothetical protein